MSQRRRILAAAIILGSAAAHLGSPATLGAAAPEFPVDRAWTHLIAQCDFGPRVPGSRGHTQCMAYLEKSLRTAGAAQVGRQAFRARIPAMRDSVTLVNLSARFGPPGPPVLLGAHWDTRPWSDRDPDSTLHELPILGANDGASGVGVLLALAEVLGAHPPPIPVEIVLFDGEDQGREGDEADYLLGSRKYARDLVPPYPRACIIVDIVGGRDLHICREAYSEEMAPWLNSLVFDRAEALGLSGFENRVCYAVYDDHIPFLERGIAAVDIIDMHYPEWHTQSDVPRACSPESLGQVGRLLVDLLYGGSLQ